MKPLRLFSIFTITSTLLFIGCKKEAPTTLYIPNDVKDLSIFKAGSIWIFKNEVTGLTDTVSVLSEGGFFDTPVGKDGYKVEMHDLKYNQRIFQSAHVTPDLYYIQFEDQWIETIQSCPLTAGRVFKDGNTTLTYVDLLDSIALYQHVYWLNTL